MERPFLITTLEMPHTHLTQIMLCNEVLDFFHSLFKSNNKYSFVASLGVYQPQDCGNPTGCTVNPPITGGNALSNFSSLGMFRDLCD